MKSVAISLALGLAAGAATFAVAQDRPAGTPGPFPDRGRSAWTQEDRAALMDGRIAGLRTALRLSPDQEKLWPPVEQALRDLAKQRAEAWAARRERWASFRADRAAGKPVQRDIPVELKERADRMASAAAGLRRLSEASGPLYGTLDEGQKRRLGAMMQVMGRGGMRGGHHGWRRHGMRDERGPEQRRFRHGALEQDGRDYAGLDRLRDRDTRFRRWDEPRYQ